MSMQLKIKWIEIGIKKAMENKRWIKGTNGYVVDEKKSIPVIGAIPLLGQKFISGNGPNRSKMTFECILKCISSLFSLWLFWMNQIIMSLGWQENAILYLWKIP